VYQAVSKVGLGGRCAWDDDYVRIMYVTSRCKTYGRNMNECRI